jgi:hypothetical protein
LLVIYEQHNENFIYPGENATCVEEGAVAQAQVKLTCEQCFTKFLSSTQISGLFNFAVVTTLEQLCARLSTTSAAEFQALLVSFF